MWGGGGSPFKVQENGNLTDKAGTDVTLMGHARNIFKLLHTDEAWKDTLVAFASKCDEPSWGRECIKKFVIENDTVLGDVVKNIIIDQRNKKEHIKEHCKNLNINNFEDIIFFDNERGNCDSVASLGCTVIYCPDGLTKKVWEEGLKQFPNKGKVVKL